jgi:hypothetical protein
LMTTQSNTDYGRDGQNIACVNANKAVYGLHRRCPE